MAGSSCIGRGVGQRIVGIGLGVAAVLVVLVSLVPPAQATGRPQVVLLVNNSGSETTDLLVPFAVLKDAGIADVSIIAVESGPVTLMPGLTIRADATLAEATGAPDMVIVPAMHDPEAPALLAAVRNWAAAGATIVSICDGVWVLANAGLLDDRSATGHWYSMNGLRRKHPKTRWRQDVRWVQDGKIITSAGVSASLPVAHHLVEVLTNPSLASAQQTGAAHDGKSFGISASDVLTGGRNYLLPWRHEDVAVRLSDGVDELALGTTVDLLFRTLAATTTTVAAKPLIRGRRGLKIVPDVSRTTPEVDRSIDIAAGDFDSLLATIEQRYGRPTRRLVALQIEYAPGRE